MKFPIYVMIVSSWVPQSFSYLLAKTTSAWFDSNNLLDDVIKIHKDNEWKLDRQFSIKKNTKNNVQADGDITYVFVKIS